MVKGAPFTRRPLFFFPGTRVQGPGHPTTQGGACMAKATLIQIRYTCRPDGNQVGLSHYLMAEAKKK